MSRRRIAQFKGTTHTAKVHRDTEWNEYRVTLVAADGTIESTYHSDDQEDANSTAQTILKHAVADALELSVKRKKVTVTFGKQDVNDLLYAASVVLEKYTEEMEDVTKDADLRTGLRWQRSELFHAKCRIAEAVAAIDV